MSADLVIDGITYISSRRASEITGYSQDYVGQLARAGKVVGKRIGGLWYVLGESILGYKQITDSYVPTQPVKPEVLIPADDASLVTLEGKTYVSAARASKLTSYHQDYIGQLARGGKILSKQVGRRWYVDIEALKAHKSEKDALLAAVQAESVGIQKKIHQKEVKKDESLAEQVGLHYSYKNDDRPLTPVVAAPVIENNNNREDVEAVRIPVHVVNMQRPPKSYRRDTEQSKTDFSVKQPKISIFYKILSVVFVAVITVIVFNFNAIEIPLIVKKSGVSLNFLDAQTKALASHSDKINSFRAEMSSILSSELRYTREED